MKRVASCLTVVVLTSAGLAQAQSPNSVYSPSASNGFGVPGHHYGFGAPVAGHVHHASSAYESFCRGEAAILQAQGQYNLLTSLAERNWEEIRAARVAARTAWAESIRQKERERREAHYKVMREEAQARKLAKLEQSTQLANHP